jgi:DNA-binding LacI/PurR family transcriptional regulator
MESFNVSPKTRQPAYRRIANGLREDIATGKLAPGTRLPSTDDLAAIWQSSTFTVHTALVTLVKEGWIERLNGAGTYVAESTNRFTCAAIYHGVDICSNDHPPFLRSIHGSLLKKLGMYGKESQIFIDVRPPDEQRAILPSLADAIRHRRVQCVVAPTINDVNSPALARLPVPVVFNRHRTSPNCVDFDPKNFIFESVRHLVDQGCRSVGVLTSVSTPEVDGLRAYAGFRASFGHAVRQEKLNAQEEWIRSPRQHVSKLPQFGYREFMEFWRLPEKPDGFIVYPDAAAAGVITAILELGVRTVTDRMRFVFHRNANIDLLCPFPVTWAIADEDRVAAGMVEMIQQQFRGERVTPVLVPYSFERVESSSVALESASVVGDV